MGLWRVKALSHAAAEPDEPAIIAIILHITQFGRPIRAVVPRAPGRGVLLPG